MGTNYYFITKATNFTHKHFADSNEWDTFNEEYELSDNPYFHYKIHLNKLSCGWKPLFQIHKEFSTFNQLKDFYKKYNRYLSIEDEYGNKYTWDEYEQTIINHTMVEPYAVKWVYDEDPVLGKPGHKYLRTIRCAPEEAELWCPYDHLEYDRTHKKAAKRFGVFEYMDSGEFYSHNDPDYNIDWSKGEFS